MKGRVAKGGIGNTPMPRYLQVMKVYRDVAFPVAAFEEGEKEVKNYMLVMVFHHLQLKGLTIDLKKALEKSVDVIVKHVWPDELARSRCRSGPMARPFHDKCFRVVRCKLQILYFLSLSLSLGQSRSGKDFLWERLR